MKSKTGLITGVIAAGAVIVAASTYYFLKKRNNAEKKSEKVSNASEDKSMEIDTEMISIGNVAQICNEISDTMLVVFGHLGMMAIDLTQKGDAEDVVISKVSTSFLETKNIVEKEVCMNHEVDVELFNKSCMFYDRIHDERYLKCSFPCKCLLSRIENKEVIYPDLPEGLSMERLLIINQAIIELSIRCMDRIKNMLCDEMGGTEEQLKQAVIDNESFKSEVFDLIVDAERGSKMNILEGEQLEEEDVLIASLLYENDEVYSKKMETLMKERTEKLKELGLIIQ